MTTARALSTVAILLAACAAPLTVASAQPDQSYLLTLTPQSSYQDHCLGPCLCVAPVYVVRGKLRLDYSHSDALYDYYTATSVNWRMVGHTISATGTYQYGGEVAIMHRLQLTVTVDGVPHNNDSGFRSPFEFTAVNFPSLRLNVDEVERPSDCTYVHLRIDATRSPCSVADIASAGAAAYPDADLTADDIIYFLDRFFADDPAVADIASIGGARNPDGLITADDLIVFLDAFFSGCQRDPAPMPG